MSRRVPGAARRCGSAVLLALLVMVATFAQARSPEEAVLAPLQVLASEALSPPPGTATWEAAVRPDGTALPWLRSYPGTVWLQTHFDAPDAAAATWAAEAGTAEARSEPGSAETASEATAESGAEATEAAVGSCVVLGDGLAEAAPGGMTTFVHGAAVDGREPEAEGAIGGCEGGVHVCVSLAGKRRMRFRYVDDISETIAMQPFGAS